MVRSGLSSPKLQIKWYIYIYGVHARVGLLGYSQYLWRAQHWRESRSLRILATIHVGGEQRQSIELLSQHYEQKLASTFFVVLTRTGNGECVRATFEAPAESINWGEANSLLLNRLPPKQTKLFIVVLCIHLCYLLLLPSSLVSSTTGKLVKDDVDTKDKCACPRPCQSVPRQPSAGGSNNWREAEGGREQSPKSQEESTRVQNVTERSVDGREEMVMCATFVCSSP